MNFLNKYELKEILLFFLNGLKKGAISTRASSIAFNFFLAFFPALIFFFTLIPYIPIDNFQEILLQLLGEVLPSSTNEAAFGTLNDIISNPRGGLLSFGFIFFNFSSNDSPAYFLFKIKNFLLFSFGLLIHMESIRPFLS